MTGKTTTDKLLFLLSAVYDILSSIYSSFHGCAKSSCSSGVAAQPAYIMSPFSDRLIDFALPSAPSLKLFNTRTNWDRYFPTAQNRSLANWKRWTLSLTDLYKRLGEMEGEKSWRCAAKSARGKESLPSVLRPDDKCNWIGGPTARQWRVYGEYMRIISCWGW